ncbi:MAG: extracellular solute-binding protein [Clostridiales bacterium]|nr:extracellular solute-binding protein [Clostridiales bacterium]MDY3748022.1 extracellular solute-binding protein [Lachnospiraceae bacterium]
MKKFMGCAVALMMTVSAMLTGCGQSEDIKDTGAVQVSDSSGDTAVTQNDDGEKITLKFFHNWINVDETPYFEEAEAAFEAEHPNVDIVIENVGDPDYKSKLKVMLGADDAPDIFFSWSGEFAQKFVRAGSVLDLTEYFDSDSEWKDSFIQAALVPFENEGEIYGVPFRVDCKMMVYNKELFDQYNVEVPETWDEFLDVCQTFKDAGLIPLALGNQDPWAACHYISTFNGLCVPVDVREKDYNYKTGEFTDLGYVEALNMLKTLNDDGYFTPNTNAMDFDVARNDFFIGKAAMTYMQSIEFGRCAENGVDAGVFTIPAPDNAKGSTNLITGSPDGFMISSKCQHPEEAVEFLKMLTNPQWQEKMITQLSSPAAIQNVHNEENSSEVMLLAVEECAKADGFVNWLDSDIHSKIADIYVPGLQEVIAGSVTPEELMSQVSEMAKQVQTMDEE